MFIPSLRGTRRFLDCLIMCPLVNQCLLKQLFMCLGVKSDCILTIHIFIFANLFFFMSYLISLFSYELYSFQTPHILSCAEELGWSVWRANCLHSFWWTCEDLGYHILWFSICLTIYQAFCAQFIFRFSLGFNRSLCDSCLFWVSLNLPDHLTAMNSEHLIKSGE